MSSDRSIAIKGSLWTSIATAVNLVATFARVMILTRFLEKSDFGVVSIVNMVIGLCTTFTDLGFASAIMYKQKLTDKEFSSLYWIQLVLFIIIYVILVFVSPMVSSFYKEPILTILLPIASISVLFQALGKLYDSVLQKQYQFKMLAFRGIISNFASLCIAVWMAWMGYGIYTLIVSTLSQIVIFNVWNLVTGYKFQRLRFVLDLKEVIPLMKIGIYQTGTRILDFFSSKLDVMIIGKLLGTEALGIYDLSKELVFKLVDFVRTVVSKVALPILANNNTDDESVKRKFLMITKTVAFICLPICVTVAVFSKDVVRIVYGDSYLETALLVSIFAIVTMITSISSFFDMLGIAKGRTDLNFKNTIFRIIITTPVVLITCHWSIEVVAWGQLLTTIIMLIIFWQVVVQNTYPIDLKTYFKQFGAMLGVVSSVGAIVFILMTINIIPIDNWCLKMIIYVIIYISFIIVGTRLFLMKEVNFFIGLIKKT